MSIHSCAHNVSSSNLLRSPTLGWVGFCDSVQIVCKLSRIFVFGIGAWRAMGMWCQKFDLVKIGSGSGHISEGIQSGGDEVVANLHIVIIFCFVWECFGYWLCMPRLVMISDCMSSSRSRHNRSFFLDLVILHSLEIELDFHVEITQLT